MMAGFFDKKQTESTSRPSGKHMGCHSCGLYKYVNSPVMKPYGKGRKDVLNIGEAPGESEDLKGRQWQGRAGRRLQSTLRRDLGINLFEDCVNINAINCRPTSQSGNRPPSNNEIACCRRIVLKVIRDMKPHVINLFGGSAIKSVLGHRFHGDLGGIHKWRGWNIPDRDLNAWINPLFHPSYVQRVEEVTDVIWRQDLKRAFDKATTPLPELHEPKFHFVDDLSFLEEIPNYEMVAFDYETTGIKPHAEEHEIICCSVAVDEENVYVFMMPKDEDQLQLFKEFLENPAIHKIAANAKFEYNWSVEKLGVHPKGIVFDTMLATHTLDNRPGINGVKFQTYVQFGIIDYSSEVQPYLKGKDKNNDNSLNNIHKLLKTKELKEKLLYYCGWDSFIERKLAMQQMEQINYDVLPF